MLRMASSTMSGEAFHQTKSFHFMDFRHTEYRCARLSRNALPPLSVCFGTAPFLGSQRLRRLSSRPSFSPQQPRKDRRRRFCVTIVAQLVIAQQRFKRIVTHWCCLSYHLLPPQHSRMFAGGPDITEHCDAHHNCSRAYTAPRQMCTATAA